jgi:hypothetical protein
LIGGAFKAIASALKAALKVPLIQVLLLVEPFPEASQYCPFMLSREVRMKKICVSLVIVVLAFFLTLCFLPWMRGSRIILTNGTSDPIGEISVSINGGIVINKSSLQQSELISRSLRANADSSIVVQYIWKGSRTAESVGYVTQGDCALHVLTIDNEGHVRYAASHRVGMSCLWLNH